ncbi:aromatic ring-hydroxylating dioxygenase subunit alpha [Verminephrobacter eiseniae]|nr:aromatic ring-hydroxylating dioxygenase subunit alpha [Verminephrobacter eiseniae]MCW5302347.1 aromatic ring-hydroxylating dioxygenase subunit alpha [Verminephrobacter eiseniae]MCW8179108.1 aromatic ring-hydroxylating dioxygenase subunit alpha [Verminephrobacter eiseniae]MCW8190287.1 aromatic ring-hydroxylating dioxygenase subunit alpha [Verminephrobacter eiseniae]
MGEPIVVFRNAQGRAYALEDRCCHRGVQLSLGSITAAGSLACRYHGWEYDGGGRCVHVPSLCTGTPVPEGFRVRSYPCIEQEHYVWVWMREGPPTVAAPAAIPGAGEHAWRQGTVEVACSADLMLDNILDSSHIPFVHVGTHWAYFLNRMSGFKEYEYEVRLTEPGLVVFYPPVADAQTPHQEHAASYLQFDLPDRVTVFQRGVKNSFFLVIHLVRTGEFHSRVEWPMRQREGGHGAEWLGDENVTLQQDGVILESAQRNYRDFGADFERSVPADFPLLSSRKIVSLARAGRWASDRSSLTQRKLVLVRQ